MNPIYSIANNPYGNQNQIIYPINNYSGTIRQSPQNPQINNIPINQSFKMEDMIHICRNNPQIFNQFKNMVTDQNVNYQTNNSIFNKNYLQVAVQGNIPRNAFNQYKSNNLTFVIETNDKFSKKINVKFQLSAGNKINIVVPETICLNLLLEEFVRKIGFDKRILQKDVYFLYNGLRMNIYDTRSIKSMEIHDGTIILVVDTKGILGAKKHY